MNKKIKIVLGLIVFLENCLLGPLTSSAEKIVYKRLVSLSPSITELLYVLDLQDKIVGVTRYCKFPPEAQKKPQVGGLFDVNYEFLYSLNPDLVLMQINEGEEKSTLKKMGIKTLEVETRSVTGIIDSIRVIGQMFDRQDKASDLIQDIENKIQNIKEKTKNLPKPRVLITFLRPLKEGDIREVYIAGNHTYFNDLIELAGGQNAYEGPDLITSPVVSAEGILHMNPDTIIELMTDSQEKNVSIEEIKHDWDMLPELTAYKTHRIHILRQPFIGIPGPSIAKTLDILVRLIHPEINWD